MYDRTLTSNRWDGSSIDHRHPSNEGRHGRLSSRVQHRSESFGFWVLGPLSPSDESSSQNRQKPPHHPSDNWTSQPRCILFPLLPAPRSTDRYPPLQPSLSLVESLVLCCPSAHSSSTLRLLWFYQLESGLFLTSASTFPHLLSSPALFALSLQVGLA